MNKFANVVYSYSPKNDDELELKVGDKIEVIGFEEEGWWRGRLKGRIGVFPSNFVQVVETNPPQPGHPIYPSQQPSVVNNSHNNKLSPANNNKTSISSNFTNGNNSAGSGLNNNNNSISPSNNKLIMNTQHHQDNPCGDTTIATDSRPKQNRAASYVEMLATTGKNKPLPAEPGSERPSPALNTLQIPKKRPPPLPNSTDSNNSENTINDNSTDQAPALPPKPSSQFNPMLPIHGRPPHPLAHVHQQLHQLSASNNQATPQQARVKYAYQPMNDDELAINVGDIINVLDMEIEDAGWWRGELGGKVGVFPDNFVELIKLSEFNKRDISPSNQLTSRSTIASSPSVPNFSPNPEAKLKVFASTPKGFSKELENNLEKQHMNQVSFLSLKRNKQQQAQEVNMTTSDRKVNDADENSQENNSTSPRLNHMTAHRAKGPSRRPPSNLLNKRIQAEHIDTLKREMPDSKEGSLTNTPPISTNEKKESSNMAPNIQALHSSPIHSLSATHGSSPPSTASHTTSPASIVSASIKTSPIVESNDSPREQPDIATPKTSQRQAQTDKTKVQTSPTTATTTTPQWMVNLKKVTAEKKRDPSSSNVITNNSNNIGSGQSSATPSSPNTSNDNNVPTSPDKTKISTELSATPTMLAVNLNQPVSSTMSSPLSGPSPVSASKSSVASITSVSTSATSALHTSPSQPHSKELALRQRIADSLREKATAVTEVRDLAMEVTQLRKEVQTLQEGFNNVEELKSVVEVMRNELRTCQSAIDSQKRYIKELVNNLADERSKIAAMQMEIDRNLK